MSLQQELFAELEAMPLIDPHTHIDPHSAASTTLADILGYHYYTELAHSAGLPREQIEEPGISPKEKVARLVPFLAHLDNTAQVSWLLDMCREFFAFDEDMLTESNWEALYDRAESMMSASDWEETVLQKSRLEKVFLTNDFDDPLDGFDTDRYVPCLRTDDLVFHIENPTVRERLSSATGIEGGTAQAMRDAIGKLFSHFVSCGARACAISLPPDFAPDSVSQTTADAVLARAFSGGDLSVEERTSLSRFVFWTIAEHAAEHILPFDLMIGVNRKVYPAGVFQGQDLYDKRTSLIQYARLFNSFPQVKFPISVLTHTSNQELVSYAWIFPNVICHGHWWYSNTPWYIEADVTSRLEAVPRSKVIGYYSDMYKLEFALPKFRMYRRILAKVLAEQFVENRGWSAERALDLGRQVLRGNVEQTFGE